METPHLQILLVTSLYDDFFREVQGKETKKSFEVTVLNMPLLHTSLKLSR